MIQSCYLCLKSNSCTVKKNTSFGGPDEKNSQSRGSENADFELESSSLEVVEVGRDMFQS